MNPTETPGVPRGFLSFKSRNSVGCAFGRMFYLHPFTKKCVLADDKWLIKDKIQSESNLLENEHPNVLSHL